jgi:undecaprenyl diphosphate synthase
MVRARYDLPFDPERLPRHIGIIMDGNGRWAKQRGLERSDGHRAGSRAVRTVVRLCRRLNIPYLTLYAFSVENWGRPEVEVRSLMELLSEFITKEWREIMERDIRVLHLGDLKLVPHEVASKLRSLMRATRKNHSMTLALALSYSSRDEITRAARQLALRVERKRLKAAQIDERAVRHVLQTRGLPDPDLIIRTAGERRISNFLLWQSAYAELHFSDALWPDFGQAELFAALADYQGRKRRFGLTDEQIKLARI